jgi:hypothetical protein
MNRYAKILLGVLKILLFPILLVAPIIMSTVPDARPLADAIPVASGIFLWFPYFAMRIAFRFGTYSDKEMARREAFGTYYPVIIVPPYILLVAMLSHSGLL